MTSQVNFIYNETLSWTVNGVNLVFTSAYQIDKIESLRVGGVEYTNFTFSWNVITLVDAPTTTLGSPTLDYFIVDSGNVPSSTITQQDVLDDVYRRIGVEQTSQGFPIALARTYISEAIRLINNLRVNPKYKLGQYSFNKAYDLNTTAYSATSISCNNFSTYTPSVGKIILGESEVVDYLGTNGTNTFTTISNLNTVYKSGDRVTIGYKLTSPVKKISEVFYNRSKCYEIDRRDFFTNSVNRRLNSYCLLDGYVFFPHLCEANDIITIQYVKNTYLPTTDMDVIDIENEFIQVVVLYTLFHMMEDREDSRWQTYKNEYNEQLRYYKRYLRQTEGINTRIGSPLYNAFTR